MTALITPADLAARLGDPGLRVLDATVRLLRPPGGGPYVPESGLAAYREAAIPGAAFADLVTDLAEPGPLPFALPAPARFAAAASRLGIGPGTTVVVYAQESPMWATRLWWLLRYFGFDAVRVLDGGLPAWRAAGLPVEPGTAVHPPAHFTAHPRPDLLARRPDVEQIVAAGGSCLVNALSPEVFRGEGPTSYTRPGRIPGSVNVPARDLLDQDGRFLPRPALTARLRDLLAEPSVVAYCGGGISATVPVFALALLGRTDVRLYDGSLAEWSADPTLPLTTGP
ncbi:sulfurtransferase [Actinomadura fibrosa]|uniref:Sulfurtransferase n=1 Tax=Actinomadura fibrosa TaxID=111802 RepID=A0ABW2XT96_9ACTN|nr:sulfurtransferase [Actinomadura fibrosa]